MSQRDEGLAPVTRLMSKEAKILEQTEDGLALDMNKGSWSDAGNPSHYLVKDVTQVPNSMPSSTSETKKTTQVGWKTFKTGASLKGVFSRKESGGAAVSGWTSKLRSATRPGLMHTWSSKRERTSTSCCMPTRSVI